MQYLVFLAIHTNSSNMTKYMIFSERWHTPFPPTSSKFTFSTKSGYASPVPVESLLDKDSSGPNRFQILSVVWLKIGVFAIS